MKLEKIVREADGKQKEAVCEALIASMGRLSQESLESLTEEIYELVYGCHFCRETYEEAVSGLVNEDGTHGAHFTFEEATDLMAQNGVQGGTLFNSYDFAYVLNMVYSDYSDMLGNDNSNYVRFADRFIRDSDAPNGKAWKYYRAMCR